ncbi:hypothetical protein FOA52_008715 [Chlamydomonas sp. UWO 241]|nr:hypothetical protein FOA52_008715 [Chlamydomonas sp. UWO 241]
MMALSAAGPASVAALPLAPLGPSGGPSSAPTKLRGLRVEEIKDLLAEGIGGDQYFVTGRLNTAIFDDDCRFVDPTNDVTGLGRYLTALGLLFDPQYSKVVLRKISITGPSTIEADYTSGGYLRQENFPWRPYVAPYDGHVTYTLGPTGLVVVQAQAWSISPLFALRETFTPTSGPHQELKFD